MIRTVQQSPTSGTGSLLRQVRAPLLVGFLLAGIGTSSNTVIAETAIGFAEPAQNTSSGCAATTTPGLTSEAITELRRVSGLSWAQLARLLRVTPRSLHLWVSGRAASATHEEHLARLLAFVRRMDNGDPSPNRSEILRADDKGTLLFDLLAASSLPSVVRMSVQTSGPSRRQGQRRSARVYTPKPDALINAEQESIHLETRIARAARSVKVRSGRPS